MKKTLLVLLLFVTPVFAAEPIDVGHSTGYGGQFNLPGNNINYDINWVTVTWNTQINRWLVIYNDLNFDPNNPVVPSGAINTSGVMYCAVVSTTDDPTMGTKSWHWDTTPLHYGNRAQQVYGAPNKIWLFVTTDTCSGNITLDTDSWLTVGFSKTSGH